MFSHTPARVVLVGLLGFGATALGCHDSRAPFAPTRTPTVPMQALPLTLLSVSPNKVATVVPTPVTIVGHQIHRDATVTFGDTPAIVIEATETLLIVMAPIHAAGLVNIVVTNPDGQVARLTDRFVYELAPAGLPVIETVSPNNGITTGGTLVVMDGTGFSFATWVKLDGRAVTSFVTFSGALAFRSPPHAAGHVDLAVVSPEGETRVPGGFTFVAPEDLDLNGTWEGRAGSHWDFPLTFTIRNDVLVSLSCDGADRTFSAPVSRRNGRISFVENGVLVLEGGFESDSYGAGGISVAPCLEAWEASKRKK